MSTDKISEFNRESLRRIAKEIVIRRFVLLLHIWIFLFANVVLFAINYAVNFSYPWFLWPLTGWSVLLSFHFVTYVIFRKGIVHGGTVGIIYHLSAYIIVNIFLVFVAFFTSNPRWKFTPWFFWILGGWGLGIIFHGIIYFYIAPKHNEDEHQSWLERKINRELQNLTERHT